MSFSKMETEEPLHPLPIDKWVDLQNAFKSDGFRGVSGYKVLETQRDWLQRGYKNGCKMYTPYGDIWNGLVAINDKKGQYDVVIQCPQENTEKLESALRSTKLIDWSKTVVLPFTPQHVIRCAQRAAKIMNVEFVLQLKCFLSILDRSSELYEDVSLPPEITFGYVRKEFIDLVDSTWPYRYPYSTSYFEQMIDMDSGYGLYKNNNLVTWLFIGDCGFLTHLYVMEEERRKGYAELLTKLVSNILLKEKKDVNAFIVINNTPSYNMFKKIGFKYHGEVAWCVLQENNKDT